VEKITHNEQSVFPQPNFLIAPGGLSLPGSCCVNSDIVAVSSMSVYNSDNTTQVKENFHSSGDVSPMEDNRSDASRAPDGEETFETV